MWNLGYSPFWPLLLLASLLVMIGVGFLWGRFVRKDVFSVGYRWLVTIVPSPAAPPRP